MARFAMPNFLQDAVPDFFSPKTAHGAKIVFALDDRQPGDAVIEHGGGGHKRRIIERDGHRISEKKVA